MEMCPPLFPGYAFVSIELQWSKAGYAPGIAGLIMNGAGPARVPDRVVAEIRSREVGGLVELPKARGFRRGDHVRIQRGLRWAFGGLRRHEAASTGRSRPGAAWERATRHARSDGRRDVIVRRRGSNHNTGRPRGCTDQQRGVKISLSNSGPSTHGTSETNGGDARRSACRGNVLQNYSQEQNEQY